VDPAATMKQTQAIAAPPVALREPHSDVHTYSFHGFREHILPGGQEGCPCPHSTQIYVTYMPEKDHGALLDQDSEDEEREQDLVFFTVEESLQKIMEGRIIAGPRKNHLPTNKVPSMEAHFPGQAHLHSTACSEVLPQDHGPSSSSGQEGRGERSISKKRYRLLSTFKLPNFLTRIRARPDRQDNV